MKQLTLKNFKQQAQIAKRIAVFRELALSDLLPVDAYEKLTTHYRGGILLESIRKTADEERYSFIGLQPQARFTAKQHNISILTNGKTQTKNAEPLQALREFQTNFCCANAYDFPGLAGAVVGYVAYDTIRLFEAIPDRHAQQAIYPDLLFEAYQISVVFDHKNNRLVLFTVTSISNEIEMDYKNALAELDMIESLLKQLSPVINNAAHLHEVNTDTSDAEYIDLVERAKEHIRAGDIFQVVLSRKFEQSFTGNPLSIYRVLRNSSPVPYLFFADYQDYCVVGASPEKLISVRDGLVTTVPIAGTRSIAGEVNVSEITDELLSDPKEMAEHMMLVDLARNDLGAVCKPETVKVTELIKPEIAGKLLHITSVVTGELAENYDALDALKSAFPAGTLSGAPKIRAMELIDELETSRRGLYGGAFCLLDQSGNLDSCILIRSAVLRDGIATVRAGAGIVFDSDPQAEAAETRHKSGTVLRALAEVEKVMA